MPLCTQPLLAACSLQLLFRCNSAVQDLHFHRLSKTDWRKAQSRCHFSCRRPHDEGQDGAPPSAARQQLSRNVFMVLLRM